MARIFFVIAAVLGFLGVAGGAFGAHALRDVLDPESLGAYETGIRYQVYHAFALAFAGWALKEYQGSRFKHAGWFIIAGVALFSGSLYIMSITGVRWLGVITPVGGLALLAGWFSLIVGLLKLK